MEFPVEPTLPIRAPCETVAPVDVSMALICATKGFIRTPFVIQGLLFGIIAALAASVIIVFGYNFVVDKMIAMFGSGVIEFINTKNMAVFIVPLFFIIGSVIGVFGSASSVNKYLKERTK